MIDEKIEELIVENEEVCESIKNLKKEEEELKELHNKYYRNLGVSRN